MTALAGVISVLFVPGSRPDRFAKAADSGAGLAVIDLEDAVAPADKARAREAAVAAVRDDPRYAVRINSLVSREGLADLLALADAPPAALFIPKVESAGILAVAAGALAGTPLVPLIETPEALANAAAIARAPGVAAVMLGGADLCAELGVEIGWDALLHARGVIVMAAAGAGVPAIDVPSLALDDPEAVAEEARRVKALGFTSKSAIHPSQLASLHATFSLTPAERDAFQQALAAHRAAPGASRWKGSLLEAPVIRRYERLLSLAEASTHA